MLMEFSQSFAYFTYTWQRFLPHCRWFIEKLLCLFFGELFSPVLFLRLNIFYTPDLFTAHECCATNLILIGTLSYSTNSEQNWCCYDEILLVHLFWKFNEILAVYMTFCLIFERWKKAKKRSTSSFMYTA
jgi:hypothetical protein